MSWPSPVHRPIAAAGLRPTPINEPLVNWDALHGQPALDAIRRTGGTVLALTDAQLLSVGDLGWALGGASPSGAAGVAGYALGDHEFVSLAGVHVAVLTDRAIDSQQGTAMEGDRG